MTHIGLPSQTKKTFLNNKKINKKDTHKGIVRYMISDFPISAITLKNALSFSHPESKTICNYRAWEEQHDVLHQTVSEGDEWFWNYGILMSLSVFFT